MSTSYRVLCGVPQEKCTGGLLHTDQVFDTHKAHSSHNDAFKCMRKHLLSSGYIQVGGREFQKDGGPVLVLTKKIRYGGRLRRGKTETGIKAQRFEPMRGSGVIF